MKAKQKLFADYYSERGTETYKNGAASARKAGYSATNAASQAVELIKNPDISQYINNKEQEQENNFKKTKEGAVEEARHNYEIEKNPRIKKQWFDTWLNLQGWLINKTEVKNETEISVSQSVAIEQYARARALEERKKLQIGTIN